MTGPSGQRRSGSSRPGEGGAAAGSPTVSPLMVPMLVLGLVIGFLAGYFLLGWGLPIVLAVLAIAVSMVLTGRSRDGATGAVVGVILGYGGVMLLALFRGVL